MSDVTEVDRICLAALAQPISERAAFIADACRGDDVLRQEVESLLAQSLRAEPFMEQPAIAGAGALAGLSGLSLGQRLGPYHIVAKLGTGGMGEVYRAHDTHLGREVAIKVLPVIFATDPDRAARFEREARILASLNHPHIAAIYGVEAGPADDGVPRRALVMELIEGPTLAERIRRGPLSLAEALAVARQIADALDAAHAQGIVHRDLKPANIKIRPDGTVKVLDFGLAKSVARPATATPVSPDPAHSPTFRTDGRNADAIVGTAAYMSPEQARGDAVDNRTDIWAFGCVLFEMLAGRSVFAAASVTETLSEVLKTEPDWQHLPADTPAGVRRLLRRCLTKDRARRLADIRDAQFDLDEGPDDVSHRTKGKSRDVSLRLAIAVISAVAAIAALTWIVSTMLGEEAAPPRTSRLSIPLSGPAAIAGDVTITPDGTRVVYVGNKGTQIFVRWLDRLDPMPIVTAAAPLNSVFVSTDGQSVGFGEGGRLKKAAITGGGPVEMILDTGGSDATWASDNTIIFVSQLKPGLQRVSVDGGDVTPLTQLDPERGELAHAFPEMLPGGGAVLFTITYMSGGPGAAQVAVLDLATRTYKPLVPGSRAQYVPSGRGSAATRAEREGGHLVYTAGGALLAIPFDLGALKTVGTAVTVVPRVESRRVRDFDVTADETLVYVDEPETSEERTLVWVDRHGVETPVGAKAGPYLHPRLSPNGGQIAVARADLNAIWVWDVRRQQGRQVTFERGGDFGPLWTPNGDRLIFRRTEGFFWQRADGTGLEKLGAGIPTSVTPDGKQVLFSPGPGGEGPERVDTRHPPRRTTVRYDRDRAQRRGLTGR